MTNEVITVKVANMFGDIVVSKRQEWALQTESLHVYMGEAIDSAFLILPRFNREEWHVVKYGGNWRHAKAWLQSYDGRYTMYISYRRVVV